MSSFLSWMASWVFPRQQVSIQQFCHNQPNWHTCITKIDSLDKWKVLVHIMFEDGKNEQGRALVLNVVYNDVITFLRMKGKTIVALQIRCHYLSWQLKHPYLKSVTSED